ncbi:hypothetical protein, partial [Flammeovirga sp. OC4]|uniref:hypothetical protein n=1 Tax=Flammeovirga sp. OC4 TaxID=1382345 RepID=UPI0005C663D7
MQSLNYVYTLNGALKAINKTGEDTNAFEDVFAMQLQYFSGDYENTATPLPKVAMEEEHYDGQIYALLWEGNYRDAQHDTPTTISGAYQYSYDFKGQLVRADYGTTIAGVGNTLVFTPNNAYSVGNLAYDANGNIQTLNRNNGAGDVMHNLSYTYDNTYLNRLREVTNHGNTYASYTYDAIGQLEESTVEGIVQKPSFNVQGYMTSISDENEEKVVYNYNTLGFRSSKHSYTEWNSYIYPES